MTIYDTLVSRHRQQRLERRRIVYNVLWLILAAILGIALLWLVWAITD